MMRSLPPPNERHEEKPICFFNDVEWHPIGPGQPRRDGEIESVGSGLRDGCLVEEILDCLADARRRLALRRHDNDRPHASLGTKARQRHAGRLSDPETPYPTRLRRPEPTRAFHRVTHLETVRLGLQVGQDTGVPGLRFGRPRPRRWPMSSTRWTARRGCWARITSPSAPI